MILLWAGRCFSSQRALYIPPGAMANTSGSRRCCRSNPAPSHHGLPLRYRCVRRPWGSGREEGSVGGGLSPAAALYSGWGRRSWGGRGVWPVRLMALFSPGPARFALFLLCSMGTLLSSHTAPIGGHDLTKIISELRYSSKGLLRDYVSVTQPCVPSRFFPMLSIVPRRRGRTRKGWERRGRLRWGFYKGRGQRQTLAQTAKNSAISRKLQGLL